MRIRTVSFALNVVVLALVALGTEGPLPAPAPSPTPADISSAAPSTKPATFSLRGQVCSGGNRDLHKVDLTRVVVYVESDPVLDRLPIPAEHPAIAQKNKEFIPKFMVVPKGTIVEFPNWDHIAHNVFSRSAAAPAFDLDRYPYGQSKSREFEKTGIVQLFCNIHPYMRAIVFVTPNAFFVRADKEGRFQIDQLPVGNYQVTAWQERCRALHQQVNVGPDSNPAITFNIEEDRDSIISYEPRRREEGYGIERGLGIKQEQLHLPVVRDAHPAPTTAPCPTCNRDKVPD